jgi:hypothetical protein
MQTVRLRSRLWRNWLAGGAVLFTLESEILSIGPQDMAAALRSASYRPAAEPATCVLMCDGIETPQQTCASVVGRFVRVA